MNRLTERNNTPIIKNYNSLSQLDIVVNKLCELEDIEEKLGISLETLFKALENGIYTNIENYEDYNLDVCLCCASGYWHLEERYSDEPEYFDFKDYGKTWALSKEELEK